VHAWSKRDKSKAQTGAPAQRRYEWRGEVSRSIGIKTDGYVKRKADSAGRSGSAIPVGRRELGVVFFLSGRKL